MLAVFTRASPLLRLLLLRTCSGGCAGCACAFAHRFFHPSTRFLSSTQPNPTPPHHPTCPPTINMRPDAQFYSRQSACCPIRQHKTSIELEDTLTSTLMSTWCGYLSNFEVDFYDWLELNFDRLGWKIATPPIQLYIHTGPKSASLGSCRRDAVLLRWLVCLFVFVFVCCCFFLFVFLPVMVDSVHLANYKYIHWL